MFIPQNATICSSCTPISLEEPNSLPNTDGVPNLVESMPQPSTSDDCALCAVHEKHNGSLCEFRSTATLSNYSSEDCQKCRRRTSLPLKNVSMSYVKKTLFGCALPGEQEVARLCEECSDYVVNGHKASWSTVWSSVILDFLCGKYNGTTPGRQFHHLLPPTILKQYQHIL